MEQHFTHLHVHTDYSLLDGAIPIEKLIDFAKKNSMKAVGISDHGNIFGAVKLFQQAKKAGIKPILGIEAYLTEDARIKNAQNKYYHIIIIVENEVGYRNVCKMLSFAYQEGFYFKPRIDYALLEKHSEGLIVTTACLGGHIPQLLLENHTEKVDEYVDWYLRVFGRDRFYLEVQPADQEEQKILNQKIFELSARKNLQVVATGDCHYTTPEDHEAHEVMLSIQTHHKITDADRFSFGEARVHLRTKEEMLALFPEHPDAIWATGRIADRCQFQFETGKLFFPHYAIPDGETYDSYFTKISHAGLQELFDKKRIEDTEENKKNYTNRLQIEIDLIIKMGFVGYFLVVSDFIQWAKKNDIPVGPGRGSAAGSLVAWALQITDIDPIKYNLLFERFLNPERVSMPDIDIDFCIEGRDTVIQYVKEKYGHDKVCQIITFGTMMAKGVIKDVARVLGFPFEDSNAITTLIPEQLKITLKESFEQEQKLQELYNSNPRAAKLFDLAFRLEGLTRHASKHAAGIVISPEPISEILPVYVPPKTTDLVAQYAMTELESLGFLKMDFLGLKNLTLIDQAIKLIHRTHGILLDITQLPLDDAETFALISRGETSGVFQLESDGLKDVLKRLQPTKFEDIIAVNALYRPGPLGSGMVDDFIERRHGRQKIEYLLPELQPILEETYGVIVYQEQVMKIASAIGGYSLGESDILRRAMGKKKAEVMAEQRAIFTERAITRKFDAKKAGELFDLMAYFAGYGFNKSHSAAYALIAYQTAYLKAHFCAEFMACLISLEAHDAEKMAFYLQEVKALKHTVLPPDINTSWHAFTVEQNAIRFGLQGIKNVGHTALDNIIEEREKKGPFKDLFDFCMRVDLRVCNKRVVENLICAGAFDTLPGNRAQQYDEVEKIIDIAIERKKEASTGQMGLFSVATTNNTHTGYAFAARSEWPDKEKLEKEKEVIGVYISAQPLDSYDHFLQFLPITPFSQILQKSGTEVIGCGILKSSKIVTTKKGDKMSFVQLEDRSGVVELVLFPKVHARLSSLFTEHTIFVVKGIVDETSTTIGKIKVNDCIPLERFMKEGTNIEQITLSLPDTPTETILTALKATLIKGTIPLKIKFKHNGQTLLLASKEKIAYNETMLQYIISHGLHAEIKL